MRIPIPSIAALLLLMALPLFAVSPTVVDDVIRMSRAGVPDDTILTFVHAKDGVFDIGADDIIAMKKAGVSSAVIQGVIDEASARNPQPAATTAPAAPPAEEAPVEDASAGGVNWVFDAPLIPNYFWDPWWYMPRLDTKSGKPTILRGPLAAPAYVPEMPVNARPFAAPSAGLASPSKTAAAPPKTAAATASKPSAAPAPRPASTESHRSTRHNDWIDGLARAFEGGRSAASAGSRHSGR